MSWHRRGLAVVAAVLAVLSGLAATAPPSPPTALVLRARFSLPGGSLLQADQLERVALPPDAVPDDALPDLAAAVGQRLAGPVSAGAVLGRSALVSARAVSAPGRVLAPVRVSDADVVELLRPGDLVDVLSVDAQSGRATTAARGARVVTIPAPPSDAAASTQPGGVVVLDVDRASVTRLAAASSGSSVEVVWP